MSAQYIPVNTGISATLVVCFFLLSVIRIPSPFNATSSYPLVSSSLNEAIRQNFLKT